MDKIIYREWDSGDWFEILDDENNVIDSGHSVNKWTVEKLMNLLNIEIKFEEVTEDE